MRISKSVLATCSMLACLVLFHPAPARAETGVLAGGLRLGFSVDPDQIVFGGQLQVGPVAPQLTFDPSLDLGFGDDVTTIAMNFDLHYHFLLEDSDWRPYVGPGIGIAFYEFDRQPPFSDDSDTEVGGNIVLGTDVRTRAGNDFFGEFRLGLGDIPDLKLMVGWNFGL
jgi:hypothetical protein